MILLFDNTCSKEQVDNPQWVWNNWAEGIPCLSYIEAEKFNRIYFNGNGHVGLMVSYDTAKARGYV